MITEAKLERAEQNAEAVWKAMYQPEASTETDKTAEETADAEGGDTKTIEEAASTTEETVAEETSEEVAAVAVEPDKSDTTDWKQKYQTLDGKYRAEVPRLSAEIVQWRDYAAGLSKRVGELEEAVKVAASQPKPKDDGVETDRDFQELALENPNFAKVIQNIKDDYEAKLSILRREKETLESGVTADIKSVKEDLQLSKQERFDLAMRNFGVPDWREVDYDPAFKEWLNTTVPYTNATKLELLVAAAKNLDAKTASQFFLDFKASQTPVEEAEVVGNTTDKLTKFVALPRSGGTAIPTKSAQPGLTRAQYEKFMNPRYKFNPSDWGGKNEHQVEAMFDAAILKGNLY
jgi:hypothetical protein